MREFLMDLRVRRLYKDLLYITRDYNYKTQIKQQFKTKNLQEGLEFGRYIYKEFEALIYLKKYRAMKRRYE
jgi:hypothetical protein